VTRSALELVQAFFDAVEPRSDLLAATVEFLPLTHELAYGPAGVIRALDDIAEQFRDYDVRPAELKAVGDQRVLVQLERTGLSHHSDMPISDRFAQIFTVRDGRIARIESFRTLEAAVAALG